MLRFLGDFSFAIAALALVGVSLSTWVWMLHAWSSPRVHRRIADQQNLALHEPCFSFALLVPARHEEDVLEATLERLAVLDYPWYEVVVIVGDDDQTTRVITEEAARRHPGRIRFVIDNAVPKSKPRALNAGIASCESEIIGIFDAEDEVSLDILRKASSVLEVTGADVVQGSVQLVTVQSSWFAVRNCLEYFFWFRSRLHAHVRRGFVPLGGNTVFFRRDAIVSIGGWDGSCLAEDCDIGIRLSSIGSNIAVLFNPHVTTREETPETLSAFVRQRTRWNQGYLQVLRKKDWKQLPTRRQRVLAQYVLAFPLIQSATGLLVPVAVALALLGHLPLLLTLLAFTALFMTLAMLTTEFVGLRELSRTFYIRIKRRDYLRLFITLIPYQLTLAFAAARSIWKEFRGDQRWEKTAHAGLHRSPVFSGPKDF